MWDVIDFFIIHKHSRSDKFSIITFAEQKDYIRV